MKKQDLTQESTQTIRWGSQIDGFVQDCSNSIANAMELLQSYTEPFAPFLNSMHRLIPTGKQ